MQYQEIGRSGVSASRVALGVIAVLAAGALAFSIVDRRREVRCG